MRTIKNLIGSVLISIAIFIVWVVILPDYDARSYLQSAVELRLVNLETKNRLLGKVNELDKEYQSRYAGLKRLSLVVPSEKHIDEMITNFDYIFSSNGIPLGDMSMSSGKGEFGSSYDLVSIEFTFSATYDSLINFLNSIEKSLRLIDTLNLTVGINQEESIGTGSQQSLDVAFKARAYIISEESQVQNIQRPARSEE